MSEHTLKIDIENEGEKPKYSEWEIESAVRTIIEAEKIKQDAELMALVKPELDKQIKATSSAADILYGKETKGENDEQ